MDIHCEKKRLRASVLSQLKAKPSAQRAAESAALRALLSPQLSATARPLTIALYASLPHEVDLMPLLTEFPQHLYAFPRCLANRQMVFHRVTVPRQDLKPGAMGILTPQTTLPCLEPEEIDLLLVPGVAFTPSGERLGYGGGYYDNFIPRCPQARVLALAFREQLVDTLPSEAHDIRLPQVLHG